MPSFSPYRRATRTRLRITLFLLGPLLWVIALVVVAAAVQRTDTIQIGLVIAAGSFVLAVVFLAVVRRLRVAEEPDASPPR